MSASPFSQRDVHPDRPSDAPMAFDLYSTGNGGNGGNAGHTGSTLAPPRWMSQALSHIPRAWLGMSGYLVAGVFLGLVLIVALSMTRGSSTRSAASAGIVTDNIVHLASNQISPTCWRGADSDSPARVTVSLEVGLDGKVRNARAAGESPAMRACIESHVKSWEFLPQANPSQMVLPFEIDPR
jgi:hypothetical protein